MHRFPFLSAQGDSFNVLFGTCSVTSLNTLIIIQKSHTADTSEGCLFLSLWCFGVTEQSA